jgi:hypothetical protein
MNLSKLEFAGVAAVKDAYFSGLCVLPDHVDFQSVFAKNNKQVSNMAREIGQRIPC